jgi:hypothetical protein
MRTWNGALLGVASWVAMTACSGSAEQKGEGVGRASEAVSGSPFYYLRCNSTDWNVDETSRLKVTLDPQLLSLSVNVGTTSDSCSVTQVTATAPDSWGTSQTYWTSAHTLAVPASGVLTANVNQTTFNVNYPAAGAFVATFNTASHSLAIAPAATIEGRVTQAPGFGISGTAVTLKGPSGGAMGTALTNANGAYAFPNLGPATYSVGFASAASTAQPTYSITGSPAALLGTPTSVDATCVPGSGASCTPGPAITDPLHRLFIVDPGVTDPTIDPSASNATDGHFSFRYLLESLSGCASASTNPVCVTAFVNRWIANMAAGITVNGFTTAGRNQQSILNAWPKLADGQTLDMTQTPFVLLAIVNRTDLHSAGQGEARLVYGLQSQTRFSVIAEFALPSTTALPSRFAWVDAFYSLPIEESHAAAIACSGSTNPSCAFAFNLQTLTDAFVAPAQLLDVRTNDFADGASASWAWLQFTLSTSGGTNTLVQGPTPETPPPDLNGAASVASFVSANAAGIRSGLLPLAPTLLGGEARDATQGPWVFPTLDATTLHAFSGRTCNGCHAFEVSDPFTPGVTSGPLFHVNPTLTPAGDGSNILSPFVLDLEIPRRESFMSDWLACGGAAGACAAGADIAVMQPNVIGM